MAAEISTMLTEQRVRDTKVEATLEGIMITLSNIEFPAESAVLPDSEKLKLQEIAHILKQMSGIKLLVTGHTARAGSTESQMTLSHARALAVVEYLVSLGAVWPDDVTVVGHGANRPVADHNTPEGMAANRRVEITILDE
jgi:outer membrane protein OmpA-like peptidoglycan-associated protein